MTKKEKWELCKPLLLQNDWTQEDIDNADSSVKKTVIDAVEDYLIRKNKEQYENCLKVLVAGNKGYMELAKSVEFAEDDFELERIIKAANMIDKQELVMFYNILGPDKFRQIFSSES